MVKDHEGYGAVFCKLTFIRLVAKMKFIFRIYRFAKFKCVFLIRPVGILQKQYLLSTRHDQIVVMCYAETLQGFSAMHA